MRYLLYKIQIFTEGKNENIGELGACRGGVGEFLRDEKDEAIRNGERVSGETNDRQHEKLVLGALHLIGNCRDDKRDEEGEKAIDAAGGVELVNANVFGQEIGVPCRITRAEKLVDRGGKDDPPNEGEE